MKQRHNSVIHSIICAAFVLGGFLASCAGPFGASGTSGDQLRLDQEVTLPGMGAIRLVLPATGASRGTIIPAALASAHHYKITLTPTAGTATDFDNVTSSPWTNANVTPGTYNLSVKAYSSSSTEIGASGTVSITVTSGVTTTTSIAIAASGTQSMTGTGTLGTTISWPATAVDTVTVTLYKQSVFLQAGATAVSLGTLVPDYSTGKLPISTSLASGNYVMVVQLSKGGVLYPPLYEAVQIYDGSTSDSTGTGTGTGTTTTAGLSVTATELGTAPTAPTGLFATKAADGKVSLYWSDASNTESGFKVYKDGVLVATLTAANSSSWTDTSTTAATTGYTVASYNGLGETLSTVLSVTPPTVLTVTSPTDSTAPITLTVAAPGSTRLSPSFTPATTTFQDITWTSIPTTVATVDASGTVTAVGPGTATITWTSRSNTSLTGTVSVTVPATSSTSTVGFAFSYPASTSSLGDNLGGTTPEINKGTSPTDVLTFIPPAGVDSYTWTIDPVGGGTPSSGNPGTLSVNSTDLTTGTHTVRLTVYEDGVGPITKDITFTVANDATPTTTAKTATTPASILNADDAADTTSPYDVTGDINLPKTGPGGTTITWAISPTTFSDPTLGTIPLVDPQGHVTRPSTAGGNQAVTLTATFSGEPIVGGVPTTTTQTYTLTVLKQPATDTASVTADKGSIIPLRFSPGDGGTPTGYPNPVVTGPLDLPTTGPSGTLISWSAEPKGLTNPDGTVTRPAVDTTVVLTAEVSKGTNPVVTEVVSTTVTVLAKPTTEVTQVSEDLEVLFPRFPEGTGPLVIDRNIDLPTSGPSGSPISWKVYDTSTTPWTELTYPTTSPIDPATGDITKPTSTKSITLVATVGDGTPAVTKEFPVTVLGKAAVGTPARDADALALEINFKPGNGPGSVTESLDLPTTGPNGSTITWALYNPDGTAYTTTPPIIVTTGTDTSTWGDLTRPTDAALTDHPYVLKATITSGGVSTTKDFPVVVEGKPQVAVTTATLTTTDLTKIVTFAPGEGTITAPATAPSITSVFELPTMGPSGQDIEWIFPSPSPVLSPAPKPGVLLGPGDPIPVNVTRPTTDTTVILKAKVIVDGVPVVIDYPVIIPAKPGTTVLKVAEDAIPTNILKNIVLSPGDTTTTTTSGGTTTTTTTVTSNFVLPTVGGDGSTITWTPTSTEKPDVPGSVVCGFPSNPETYTNGLPIIVTRPTADTVVTFTGTVSQGTAPVVSQPVIVKVTVKGTAAASSNGSLTATVSFANPSQPTFSLDGNNSIIYKSSATPTSLTVTATSTFASYTWKVDGVAQTATTKTITVNASDYAIGKHRIWLSILSGTYVYDAYVTFEVRY